MRAHRASAGAVLLPPTVQVVAPEGPSDPVARPAAAQTQAARTGERMAAGPQLPKTITPPMAPAERLHAIHDTSLATAMMLRDIRRIMRLANRPPQMRTIVINANDDGSYQTVDQANWRARSIGVLNPGAAPIYIGLDGQPATLLDRVPSCPGASCLVLPVSCQDINLGCDAATLGSSTAVVFVFRYYAVQPLSLTQMSW